MMETADEREDSTAGEAAASGPASDGAPRETHGEGAGESGEPTADRTGGEDATPTEPPSLSYDDCFDLLSNHRRRYALHYLQQCGQEVALGELTDQVAAWENGVDVDAVSPAQRKRVYTSLQQVHLPRMDDLDVVAFDDEEGRVVLGPAVDDLDVYLEVVREDDIPWSAFYLSLAVVNAALVGSVLLGVSGLAAVPGVGWMLFVLTTFLVAALAHVYLARTEMRLGRGDRPPDRRSA